jgi:hypothetical protein
VKAAKPKSSFHLNMGNGKRTSDADRLR